MTVIPEILKQALTGETEATLSKMVEGKQGDFDKHGYRIHRYPLEKRVEVWHYLDGSMQDKLEVRAPTTNRDSTNRDFQNPISLNHYPILVATFDKEGWELNPKIGIETTNRVIEKN